MRLVFLLIFALIISACGDSGEAQAPRDPVVEDNNPPEEEEEEEDNNDSPLICTGRDQEACTQPCSWLTTSCEGYTVGACFKPNHTPFPLPCFDLEPGDCHLEFTSDACDRGSCTWLRNGGCGAPEELIRPGEDLCLPRVDCQQDPSVCPQEHTCMPLSTPPPPCEGENCDAVCAEQVHRCVPDEWLRPDGPAFSDIADLIRGSCAEVSCHGLGGPSDFNIPMGEAASDEDVAFALQYAFPVSSGRMLVVPGEPSQSELFIRIDTDIEEMLMPPVGRLPQSDIDMIELWIASGAHTE